MSLPKEYSVHKAGLLGWWGKPGGRPRPVNRGVHMISSDTSAPQRSGQPLPTKWTKSECADPVDDYLDSPPPPNLPERESLSKKCRPSYTTVVQEPPHYLILPTYLDMNRNHPRVQQSLDLAPPAHHDRQAGTIVS